MQLSSYPTKELITLQLALCVAHVHARNNPEKLEIIEKWNERVNDAIYDSAIAVNPFSKSDTITITEKPCQLKY